MEARLRLLISPHSHVERLFMPHSRVKEKVSYFGVARGLTTGMEVSTFPDAMVITFPALWG